MKSINILILIFAISITLNGQNINDCDSIHKSEFNTKIMFALVGRTAERLIIPDNPIVKLECFLLTFILIKKEKLFQLKLTERIHRI